MDDAQILIVDDELIVRNLCGHILSASGFRTLKAENGKQALEVFHGRNREIDLILSDVSMPIMNGLEFVRAVFQSDPHANVILMSGYQPYDTVPEELERVCKLLRKPFAPGALVTAVKDCLGSRVADRAALTTS